MVTKVITHPTTEPISIDEVARHLRLGGSPYADATLITVLTTAARQWVEEYTRMAIGTQTLELVLDSFPSALMLRPYAQIVTSIKYLDTAGVEQTLSASGYTLDNDSLPCWVTPAYGYEWPDTYPVPNSVRVRYVAGYTSDTDSPAYPMPKPMYAAILLTIGDLYENREGSIVGTIHTVNPAVDRLLSMYRLEMGF